MGREMKHTEIGDIPADWEVQTFEETFQVLTNNTLSRADLNDSEGTIRNIHYGDILTRYSEVLDCGNENIPFLNSSSLLTATAMPLQDGDVILADTAEDETVGKATEIYGLGEKKMVAGLHTIPCRVKKGNFAPHWLGYYMNSHVYHNQLLPYITGIKVSSISKSAIAGTMILVPPLLEQEKIVAVLSEIDALIVNLQKLIGKHKAIKQGCLGCMFPRNGQTVPERRLPGFTCDWELRKLGEIAEFRTGPFGTQLKANEYTPEGTPVINVKNIGSEHIIPDNLDHIPEKVARRLRDHALQYGDIVFGRKGAVDRHAFIKKEETGWIQGSDCIRMRLKLNYIVPLFVTYELSLPTLISQIKNMAVGGTMISLNPDILSNLVFSMPAESYEQQSIGTFFHHLDHLITLNQRKAEKYKMIKQGIMSELLTGKIRPV